MPDVGELKAKSDLIVDRRTKAQLRDVLYPPRLNPDRQDGHKWNTKHTAESKYRTRSVVNLPNPYHFLFLHSEPPYYFDSETE